MKKSETDNDEHDQDNLAGMDELNNTITPGDTEDGEAIIIAWTDMLVIMKLPTQYLEDATVPDTETINKRWTIINILMTVTSS